MIGIFPRAVVWVVCRGLCDNLAAEHHKTRPQTEQQHSNTMPGSTLVSQASRSGAGLVISLIKNCWLLKAVAPIAGGVSHNNA